MCKQNCVLSPAQIAARLKADGEKVLVLLVGVPGSGKTTLAKKLLAQTSFVHLNADSIREEVTGDENNHDKDEIVWALFQQRFDNALASGGAVLVDNMNHTRGARAGMIQAARAAGYDVKLVYLEVPLDVCIERNRARGKQVEDFTIMHKHMKMKMYGAPDGEWSLWLAPARNDDEYRISPKPQYDVEERLDIIGDVHGCYDELRILMGTLGYRILSSGKLNKPKGRNLAILGDLTDRGPDSAGVLDLCIKLWKQGVIFVLGNHCYKLLRALKGHKVKISDELQVTIDGIRARGAEFEKQVIEFLAQIPYKYENKDVILVHAAYSQLARGERAERLALYGETDGKFDENGFPIRAERWETAYMGGKTIVHGHMCVPEPIIRHVSNGGRIVNVDTSCCFGGKLTALRFPEMELISVPARKVYFEYTQAEELASSSDEATGETVTNNETTLAPSVVYPGVFGVGKGLPTLPEFQQTERDGWVWSKTRTTKAGHTYRLFNYNKRTAYERVWTPVTLVSRGIIVCEETGECVAAPLEKFFNLGETIIPGQVAGVLDGAFDALVKLDGSCGIGYRFDGEFCWATRGSFFSKQAKVAQMLWDRKYKQHDELLCTEWNHLTLTAEIIHPLTRVVVQYDFEDLVLINVRNRFTGEELSYEEMVKVGERLGMPVVERLKSSDLEAILRRCETLDGNNEGFVLVWSNGRRRKVKGDEYKRLHRLLSGITPRILAFGWWDGSIEDLLRLMPEEFREETERLVAQLDGKAHELLAKVQECYAHAPAADPRAFAAWVKEQDPRISGFLFARKQMDAPQGVSQIARAALARLHSLGQLSELANQPGSPLSDAADVSENDEGTSRFVNAMAQHDRLLGDFLWENTRTPELTNQVRRVVPQFPKQLRGVVEGALTNLLPELVVEKMREYVKRELADPASKNPELAELDVDAVFATAPKASAPDALHTNWVFMHPLVVRPFLDRWRFCGQRSTAYGGARKLLSEAFRTGSTAEYLQHLNRLLARPGVEERLDVEALVQGAQRAQAHLEKTWTQLPHDRATEIGAVIEELGTGGLWARALFSEAWGGLRASVRDEYISSGEELDTLQRLDDE